MRRLNLPEYFFPGSTPSSLHISRIVDPAQWTMLRERLIKEIDEEADSLRFYFLGSNWKHRVEHVGAKASIDQEGPLII